MTPTLRLLAAATAAATVTAAQAQSTITIVSHPLATMPQYMAFDPGAGVGGVFQSHTPATPALAYIYATNVEAKLAEIEAAGGKRVGAPMRMPGAGCFGYFQDPSGTSIGLIGP